MTSARPRRGSSTCSRSAGPSSMPADPRTGPGHCHFRRPLPPLDGLHRQRRRPARPDQGLRQQRRRQWHGGGHVGARSGTGMGTPLRAGAVGRQHLRRPLPRRRRGGQREGVDQGPQPPGRDPPDPLPAGASTQFATASAPGAGQHRLLSAVAFWGVGGWAGAESNKPKHLGSSAVFRFPPAQPCEKGGGRGGSLDLNTSCRGPHDQSGGRRMRPAPAASAMDPRPTDASESHLGKRDPANSFLARHFAA